ncbi:MAG TPA: hypothetical protein VGH87_20935, partial [Polyangiaceae bacterium]
GLRYHVALCEEKLGRLVDALADYTAADQMAREQNNKDVIDAVAEPLKTLRIRVPTLTIEVPAAQGSQVELDGKAIAQGLYGVAMPVEAGTHKVTARAPGKRLFATQVTLHEREADTATVKWVDIPPEPALDRGHETPEKPVATKSGPVKVGAIVATAVSAVFLGVGIGAFVAADGAHSDLAAQCPLLTNCDDLRNTVRTWDWVALGSWIGAAGVAVVAVVLWAKPSAPQSSPSARIEPRTPERSGGPRFGLAIELRPGGLAFTGSF